MKQVIKNSWKAIAPFWPLKNIIAINPLQGFEDQSFEQALESAELFFQRKDLPKKMKKINRETIKWLQPFFDQGEAKIPMPQRKLGLFKAVTRLLPHDRTIKNRSILDSLPTSNITEYLFKALNISPEKQELFATLLLTTLPGWASYVKYYAQKNKSVCEEYLQLRLLLTLLFWPKAQELLSWHDNHAAKHNTKIVETIKKNEEKYHKQLLAVLEKNKTVKNPEKTIAQFIFCIDVRSEPVRRSIELLQGYETLSMAGFFGLPIAIKNKDIGITYNSCPPIVEPQHTVVETNTLKQYQCFMKYIQKVYQSIKYTFATPFALAEMIGITKGFWMAARTFAPGTTSKLRQTTTRIATDISISSIPLKDQVAYAQGALKIMGLTMNFAPIVIFCGHDSATENNAYETGLDCGACAGRSGLPNARVMCKILNCRKVRMELGSLGIIIPESTNFIPAVHNTATDEIAFIS